MKKVIAGVLAVLTLGTTTAFACGGHHGGGHHGYYRSYTSYSCYTDANRDGVCDNCHYYTSGHRNGYWCYH